MPQSITFQKQEIVGDDFRLRLRRGVGYTDQASQKKQSDIDKVEQPLLDFYNEYARAQDYFDENIVFGNKQEAVKILVDYLKDLIAYDKYYIQGTTKTISKQVLKESRYRGAYKTRQKSICSRVILLEDALCALNGEKSITGRKDAQEKVLEQQQRFKNYLFGSSTPVDDNADLFLSYLVPILMTYYGIMTNETFIFATYNILKKYNMEIPASMHNLHAQLQQDSTITEELGQQVREKSINEIFDDYAILDTFNNLDINNDNSLLALYRLTEAFITVENPTMEDLSELTRDQTLTLYMQVLWEQVHKQNKQDQSVTQSVIRKYDALPQEMKDTEAGLLYNILHMTALAEQREKEKIKSKGELRNTTVTAPTTPVDISSISKRKTIETPKKAKNEEVHKEPEPQKPVSKITYEQAMFEYAKYLFLSQSNYDIESLKSFKIMRTLKTEGDAVTFEYYPFMSIEYQGDNAKSVVETYNAIKQIFGNFGPNIQRGFLEYYQSKGVNFIEAASTAYQNILNNYSKTSTEDRGFLEKLSKDNTQIAEELAAAQSKAKDRRLERMEYYKKKYNLSAPDTQTQGDISELATIVFSDEPQEMVKNYLSQKK